MITKHITLYAHCGSCLNVIYKEVFVVQLKAIGLISNYNDKIEAQFPKNLHCKACEIQQIERSYRFYHDHKFEIPPPTATQSQLARLKAQIAATYDDTSNTPLTERVQIRQTLQAQYAQIQNINHLNLN